MAERVKPTIATAATLELDGWAGRRHVPCAIIGETRTKYLVKLGADCCLPGRRQGIAGKDYRVPKDAVQVVTQDKAGIACDECAGSGWTTYAERGLYQTTCRKCWGTGRREEKPDQH